VHLDVKGTRTANLDINVGQKFFDVFFCAGAHNSRTIALNFTECLQYRAKLSKIVRVP
jgi:hypothetical protein